MQIPRVRKIFLIFVIIIVVITAYAVFQLRYVLKQNKHLKIRLFETSREKEQLWSQLKEVKDAIAPLKEEISGFKKSFEEKEKKEVELNSRFVKAEAEAKDLKGRITGFQKFIEGKTKEELELKKQVTKAEVEAKDLREEFSRNNVKIKELNDRLNLANTQKASLEKINSALNNALKNSKEKLARAQEKLRPLKERLSRIYVNETFPLKKQITQLNDSLVSRNNESAIKEAQLKNLTEKYANLENINKVLEKQIGRMEAERLSLQGQLNKTSEQFFEQNELISSLRKELNSITGLFTKKAVELEDKERGMSALREEIANLKLRIVDSEAQLNITRERYKKVTEDFSELNKLNTNLQGRLNRISGFLEEEDLDKKKAGELKNKIEVILESVDSEKEKVELPKAN